MSTRLDAIRARLGVYQFAEDAFGGGHPVWHLACEIRGRRYVITDDLAFCVRALTLCQHYFARPSIQVESAMRAALAEPDV